jgi:Protein of unknown function (DUF3224)
MLAATVGNKKVHIKEDTMSHNISKTVGRLTRTLILAAALVVTVLFPLGVIGAAASPQTSVSGTFRYTGEPTSCRPAGGNTICEFAPTIVTYTGTFDGTSTGPNTLTIHADGSANFHGFYTFTGTVNGIPGTVTFEANGSGTSDLQFQATLTSVRGTGALANLHAVLKQVGTVEGHPVGTYTGQIHFDP